MFSCSDFHTFFTFFSLPFLFVVVALGSWLVWICLFVCLCGVVIRSDIQYILLDALAVS